ncbi:MAG: NAD-dependent malic enzyme [Chloroflexi bacterium]|nr:NAD-dependent malic enzyme [Chloroflexota bacterium]
MGFPAGLILLRDRDLNKGTAFTEEERDEFGLRGLLPTRVHTQEEQVIRVMENFHRQGSDLERYIDMMALQERNKTLFYRVIIDHLEEMMPIIYTPTVGEACLRYGHIFQRPRGVFISAKDRGQVIDILRNWPYEDVRLIVVTDGERILGLGDLGANGMGIPVGKAALYTACAGIHPNLSLPVTLDIGTDNKELLTDPLYIGLNQQRLRGDAYDDLVEEFMKAVHELYPYALIQFEDFASENAFRLLDRYRSCACVFNDDIQGTGSVVLAGLYSTLRITGARLEDQKFLFLGAGEAAIGTANMIISALTNNGLSEEEARQRCWFMDSKGLVVKNRDDLNALKAPFAQDYQFFEDLLPAVESIKPTTIIGASGKTGAFTKSVLEAMTRINKRPIVFSLSNPTSRTECTAEEAYTWTQGHAIFASGSPFDPVQLDGKTYVPAQANNVYVFPGISLGVISCYATCVTDEMFTAAAKILSEATSMTDLMQGRIYPPLCKIRDISARIATEVSLIAYKQGLARKPEPDDLRSFIRSQIYEPEYCSYI